MSNGSNGEADATDLLRHLALERVSPQWAVFLELLSSELQEQLTALEYRQFLHRLGVRFAQTVPLEPCADLVELEREANLVWHRMQWGYVTMSDLGQTLHITHRASPLSAALQLDADVAGGFLEGVYAEWLVSAGSPPDLALVQSQGAGVPMEMAFVLSAQ